MKKIITDARLEEHVDHKRKKIVRIPVYRIKEVSSNKYPKK